MPSLQSSNSPKDNSKRIAAVRWTVRVLLGCVFVFSGLTKAIDPWGGLYKIEDYLSAWGMTPSHQAALLIASALATFEFLLGVMTLTGTYRRFVSRVLPMFMGVMTALSLYIWIFNPVEDCGCFGDALVISNGATFLKNIVLMAAAVVLWRSNDKICTPVFPRLQWIVAVSATIYIVAVQIIGYHIQPMVDFRPYPVGTNLAALVADTDNDTAQLTFEYTKDGVTQTFTADNLPDSTWTFVRRNESATPTAPELSILDGEEDVTADVIANSGDQYIIVVSDPASYSLSRSEMANRLYEKTINDTDGDMFAVVAIPADSVDIWTAATGAEYPVYTAEDTDLKMLARGNAALVYLRNGVIEWKYNIYAIPPEYPDVADFNGTESPDSGTLWRMSLILLAVIAIPVVITCIKRRKDSTNNKVAEDNRADSEQQPPQNEADTDVANVAKNA